MSRHNPIAIFLCRFALIYLLLAIPWPGVNKAYNVFLRALAQATLAGENGLEELSFEAQGKDSKHPFDLRAVIVNRALIHRDGSGPVRNLDIGFGWLPVALLLALLLATPISWRRRGWAVLLGLLCMHIIILLSLRFIIWDESMEISLVTVSPFWKYISNSFRDVLVAQFNPAMPVLVWILATFRKEDFTAGPGRPAGWISRSLLHPASRKIAHSRP